MQRMGILVNMRFRIIICIDCRKAIAPGNLVAHLKRHRPLAIPPNLGMQLVAEYNIYETAAVPPPVVTIPAIFGLAVLPDYVFCAGCNRGYRSPKSLSRHQLYCEGETGPETSFAGFAQTFFAGKNRYFFSVTNPTGDANLPSGSSSDLEVLLKQEPVLDLSQKVIQPPANHRILSRFLAQEEWISHVAGMVPARILQMVTVPDDKWHSDLRQHTLVYMQAVQRLLTPMEINIKRRMATFGT